MPKSLVELIIKAIAPIHQGQSFFIKDSDSCVLSKAFLLPFGQSSIVLIDRALLPLSQLLVLRDWMFDVFVLSFNALVVHHGSIHIIFHISDVRLLCTDINSNSFNLFLDIQRFVGLVLVLLLQDSEFIFKTFNNIVLTLHLWFVVTFESRYTNLKSFLSLLNIQDLLSKDIKVSLIELVWLNFCSIGGQYAVSKSWWCVGKLIVPRVLLLGFLVLWVLSLFSLLSMLLIQAELGLSLSLSKTLLSTLVCEVNFLIETFSHFLLVVIRWFFPKRRAFV